LRKEQFSDLRKSILEKINDNAYKLELPPEFGVSPTFNISDLRPYLGEEDEVPSRTIPIQVRGMMRTSLRGIQPLLLLSCRDQL
jgi:hypothetical protein